MAVCALGIILIAVSWLATVFDVTVKVAVPTMPPLEVAAIVVVPALNDCATPVEVPIDATAGALDDHVTWVVRIAVAGFPM